MRSLFFRIFLWFWLVMVVIVAIVILSSPYWTRVRPALVQWEQRSFARLMQDGERAATILAAIGPEGLEKFPMRRRGLGRRQTNRIAVLAADGTVIWGQMPPQPSTPILERALSSGETEVVRHGAQFFVARPVTLAGGDPALLVVWGVSPHPLDSARARQQQATEMLDANVVMPRLAVIVIVVGMLCYWMSGYLTSPLGRLRSAVRGLAGGDLTVRVDPRVGSRSDEIGELARDFDTMAERLQSLVETRQRLLRDVSHELRSPLARLDVALALARDSEAGDAVPYMDRIERESGRLNELIASLLELTRLDAGAPRSEIPVDLGRFVREIVADARFEAESGGATVVLRGESELVVNGVPNLLQSAMENLLRNAVRYTATGSAVEVELTREGGAAVLRVRDHGPGVPEAELENIFEPFVRVGEDRDRASGGVGLGLAIAQRAVAHHGGSLRASNHPEGGLVVEMHLPLT